MHMNCIHVYVYISTYVCKHVSCVLCAFFFSFLARAKELFALLGHCNALHQTATHCNALQRTATHSTTLHHCTTLHHTAPRCTTLHHAAQHCTSLQDTVARCNTLHHTATHGITLQHSATHCKKLQYTAIQCTTLQHTATYCNIMQHTAVHDSLNFFFHSHLLTHSLGANFLTHILGEHPWITLMYMLFIFHRTVRTSRQGPDAHIIFGAIFARSLHNCMCFRNFISPLSATELYALLDKGLTPISFFAPYLPIPPHWKRDKARIQMCKLFEGVMQRRIAENRTENDVLQVFPASHTHKNTPYPLTAFFAP